MATSTAAILVALFAAADDGPIAEKELERLQAPVRAALAKRRKTLNLPGIQWDQSLEFACEMWGTQLSVRTESLTKAGFDVEASVSIWRDELTLAWTLDMLMTVNRTAHRGSARPAWAVVDGAIVIAPRIEMSRMRRTVVYDISELLKVKSGRADWSASSALLDMLRSLDAAPLPDDALTIHDGGLRATVGAWQHERIRTILAMVRSPVEKPADPVLRAALEDDRNLRTGLEAGARKVGPAETSIRQCINFIAEVRSFHCVFDEVALSSAGVDQERTVTLKFKDRTIRETLDQALVDANAGVEPGKRMAFAVMDGVIFVSTVAALSERTRVAQYDVFRLSDAEVDALIAGIRKLDPDGFEGDAVDRAKAADRRRQAIALIAELDHDDFDRRETATRRLLEMGAAIDWVVADALSAAKSAETRLRLNRVQAAMPKGDPSPGVIHWWPGRLIIRQSPLVHDRIARNIPLPR